jgi:GNAT superfamily N-acetyltransferase
MDRVPAGAHRPSRAQIVTRAMTTRTAHPSDATAITGLVLQLGYEASGSAVADRLSRLLARPDQQFIVAEEGNRLLGWVHVQLVEYVESGTFAVIGGLVVDRAHRRQGIGAALMAQAETWARAQGCAVMRLWSSTTRTPAHRFYEGLGYANIKTQYSFVKALDESGAALAARLVPQVDGTS